MAVRLALLFPRAVVLALLWLLATAAFTFAADSTIVGSSKPSTPAAPAKPADLIVPSVTGQAYVFAKGMLEDAGFAWRLTGSVRGYAANRVLTQTPAAGTRVVDTGAPTVVLRLVRGPYVEHGTPVDSAPYAGTRLRLAGLASATAPAPASKPAAKPTHKPVAKPKRKPVSKPVHKPAAKPTRKPAVRTGRPPAFVVPGAPREPLDEITLPARALRLETWLEARPKTSRNVQHWLYQHAWIVSGASFGWSQGARALEILIRVDRRVERQWRIGHKSEAVARAALRRVRRHER
jgi:PASTA domain